MLGRTLRQVLVAHEIIVADLPTWDITDAERFTTQLTAAQPDVVIHCAAMTKVDDCETNEVLAYRLNEEGSLNVARACRQVGARLFAISTDYVFSGDPPQEPWVWSEDDTPRPRTVYGMSKFAGEQVILANCPDAVILRIAWLYGRGGPSFIHTMAKLGAQDGAPLKVVADQVGNPTSTKAVAQVIQFLLAKPDVSGVVHATCDGVCSWYDLTCELKRLLPSFTREVQPCTTAEFPRPAPRPKNSALKKGVLAMLGYTMPTWQVALGEFVHENADEFHI